MNLRRILLHHSRVNDQNEVTVLVDVALGLNRTCDRRHRHGSKRNLDRLVVIDVDADQLRSASAAPGRARLVLLERAATVLAEDLPQRVRCIQRRSLNGLDHIHDLLLLFALLLCGAFKLKEGHLFRLESLLTLEVVVLNQKAVLNLQGLTGLNLGSSGHIFFEHFDFLSVLATCDHCVGRSVLNERCGHEGKATKDDLEADFGECDVVVCLVNLAGKVAHHVLHGGDPLLESGGSRIRDCGVE